MLFECKRKKVLWIMAIFWSFEAKKVIQSKDNAAAPSRIIKTQ